MKTRSKVAGDILTEAELAELVKELRENAGMTKAAVATAMGCKPPSIFHSEESPHLPYAKLRRRLVEYFSDLEIEGPVYRLRKKRKR